MKIPTSYLVLHSPADEPGGTATIDRIRIIDAFSSTATLAEMRRLTRERVEGGAYTEAGPGRVWVVAHEMRHDTVQPITARRPSIEEVATSPAGWRAP